MMIFRSQLRRQTIMNWMLMFVPNIIVAAVISWFMDSSIFCFAAAFIALFALSIVYWVIQSIVMWIAWSLVGRRLAEQLFLDYLVENGYPRPRLYEDTPQEYFVYVMTNTDLDPELRIKAAMEVGTFAAYSGALELQRLAKVNGAAESAITAYARRFASSAA